jgi:hypothetical protein
MAPICADYRFSNVKTSLASSFRPTRVRPSIMTPKWPTFSSRRITQDEYDKKARELKDRQVDIATRIEQHQEGDGSFVITLESLISIASRAAELFERSEIQQKRQLIAFVFSNLRLTGKKLDFSLRSPFDLMVNRRTYASWLGREDSNLRMAESKSAAVPLGYAPAERRRCEDGRGP